MTLIQIALTERNHALVAQLAAQKGIPVRELVRDVVDIYCADYRSDARMKMERAHYTARVNEDYTEAE